MRRTDVPGPLVDYRYYGRRFPLADALPLETATFRLRTLGYVEVTAAADCLWGPADWTCRGHEFHYSENHVRDDTRAAGWQPAYMVRRRRPPRPSRPDSPAGACWPVMSTYTGPSQPSAVGRFFDHCSPLERCP